MNISRKAKTDEMKQKLNDLVSEMELDDAIFLLSYKDENEYVGYMYNGDTDHPLRIISFYNKINLKYRTWKRNRENNL